jgi:predicted dienelactone hydrolase
MRRFIATLLLAFATLAASPVLAGSVGFQHLTIPDPQGPPIEIGIWYPTDATPSAQRIELGGQTVAPDAAVKGERLALILMSHGHGGSYAGHADTAIALAEAGFVAAALTHSGDNWRDTSAATAVWERPRQLKLLADYMLGGWRDHGRIDPARIGAFGFSAGGFTVLSAAGAEPDLTAMVAHCQAHPAFEDCQIVRGYLPALTRPIVWNHDARIKAVVSAAPALGFAFGKAGLAAVRVPVQLWRAGDDQVLPDPYYASAVRLDLPTAADYHVVAGAGHYDFLSPCSAALAAQVPMICRSAAGFDRIAFHADFNRQVVAFFGKTLR